MFSEYSNYQNFKTVRHCACVIKIKAVICHRRLSKRMPFGLAVLVYFINTCNLWRKYCLFFRIKDTDSVIFPENMSDKYQ